MLSFALSEMLAWASAQIHCQFHASENRVALPPSDGSKHDVQAENETVFVPNRGERSPFFGQRSRAGVEQAVRCVPEPLLASCCNSLLRGHRRTSLMLRSQRR